MNGPFYFSGRRWVSTKDLKDLRLGARSSEDPLFGDDRLGSYLALYWTPKGRFRDNTDWSTRQVHWLHANGRMFAERDHIHTLLYLYKGADARDADGVPPELALDHPFRGLGAVIVEPSADGDVAEVPRPVLASTGSVALVLSFRGVPLPPERPGDAARHRRRRPPRAAAVVRRRRAGRLVGRGRRLRRHGRRVGHRHGPLGVAVHPDRPGHRPLHRPALVGEAAPTALGRRRRPRHRGGRLARQAKKIGTSE